jgi:hypothetical protein
MRTARIGTGLVLAFFCLCLQAETRAQKITVTGKLTRAMAIGGESTGWSIQLKPEVTIEGKQVKSIEIDYHEAGNLDVLANKHVKARGRISHRHGVETGDRTVLEVSSIKETRAR